MVIHIVVAFAVGALFLWWADAGRVRKASRLIVAGVRLVDLATPAEFARGHVPGAINIPLADLDRRAGELDASQPLVVCGTSVLHAMLGGRLLGNLGFADVLAVSRGALVSAALEESGKRDAPAATSTPVEVGSSAYVVVSAWRSREAARGALEELRAAHVPVERLSIFVEDAPGIVVANDTDLARERVRFWRMRGALYGSFWGLLMGGAASAGAFFYYPNMGPFAFVGPLCGWVVGALEGAALGGALAALRSMTAGSASMAKEGDRRFLVMVEQKVEASSLASPDEEESTHPTAHAA